MYKFFETNKLTNNKIKKLAEMFPEHHIIQNLSKKIIESDIEWYRLALAKIMMDYVCSAVWTEVWEKHYRQNPKKAEKLADDRLNKFIKNYL